MKNLKMFLLKGFVFFFIINTVSAWNTDIKQGIGTPRAAGGTVKVFLGFSAPPVIIVETIVIGPNLNAAQKAEAIKNHMNAYLLGHMWAPAKITFEHWTTTPEGQEFVVCRYDFGAPDAITFHITDDNTGEAGQNGMVRTPPGVEDKYEIISYVPLIESVIVPTNFELTLTFSNGINATVVGDSIQTAGQLYQMLINQLVQQGVIFSLLFNPDVGRNENLSQLFALPSDGITIDYSEGWGDYFGGIGCKMTTTDIPTLSQWGLIILALLLLSIGMVFVFRRQTALVIAGAETTNAKPSLFDRSLYFKTLGIVLLFALTGLVAVYWYYGTLSMTDLFGTIVSAGIIAYMLQVWMLMRRK